MHWKSVVASKYLECVDKANWKAPSCQGETEARGRTGNRQAVISEILVCTLQK